ncbi:N6-L-threonylcarbamoyladenine synthase [Keratinibaculum paraultunense]|uniref:N(6)-L-threonylcarbamoyladenine synthase n=1 Tax=Keratinibaculum paraultunense TaxID=1278232 RepID=A0A4R3KYR9_9FIRM|nr:O-sialoglycoprotein endopeptidase [Keratinibaculum paraultunense]QQY80617.1 hypothetical protein JL105_04775 [Keratinibaculum paraultunense]TCS91348.1 N6-L-threonylcarbamoyladenine synthase [Keratinibaculum paraultunense]
MTRYFVGIDTSSYTTSLAVLDEDDNIILNLSKLLKVEKGKKGLRQQEAVFQHVQNLPLLVEHMTEQIDVIKIKSISCSTKPRNVNGSYMPVFVVGKGQAFVLSKVLNTDYNEFSHQEGHIGAGLISSSFKNIESFISLHISGGTTELLLVNNKKNCLQIEIIGGTLDISVGQLIDRIGVYAGLNFPSGKKMDEISKEGRKLNLNIPVSIKNRFWFNLSGMENYFKTLIEKNQYKYEDIFRLLFHTISKFLMHIILNACNIYNIQNVLITGGVAANTFIRKNLSTELTKSGINIYFPSPKLCTDNAVGIAYLGKIKE